MRTFAVSVFQRSLAVPLVLLAASALARPLAAQAHGHEHEHGHAGGLHFVHPLIAESVSPDTKVRLDYLFQNPGSESEMELEGEYAFHPSFSVEAGVHFNPAAAELGETHLLFKFANYAFAERGVLLGYGLSLGLPTGSGHGHGAEDHAHEDGHGHEHGHAEGDIYEIAPFLNAGVMLGELELVGWTFFSIPTNQERQTDVETSLSYNLSALYHVSPRLQAVLELDGEGGLSGAALERDVARLTPGVKIQPLAGSGFTIGLGATVPLTEDRDFDTRAVLSLFYHF